MLAEDSATIAVRVATVWTIVASRTQSRGAQWPICKAAVFYSVGLTSMFSSGDLKSGPLSRTRRHRPSDSVVWMVARTVHGLGSAFSQAMTLTPKKT